MTPIPRKVTSRTLDHTRRTRSMCGSEPRNGNQPMKIHNKSDIYLCRCSVQTDDLVGLPISTPKPEVEFYLSGIGRMEG